MAIHESAENYLETILILSQSLPKVRSIDVATEMNFKKPSVSVAMKHLREEGYLTVADDGGLLLTETGSEIAKKIYERHTVFTSLLVELGVDPAIAAEDACKIEHDLSDESFEAIKKHFSKK